MTLLRPPLLSPLLQSSKDSIHCSSLLACARTKHLYCQIRTDPPSHKALPAWNKRLLGGATLLHRMECFPTCLQLLATIQDQEVLRHMVPIQQHTQHEEQCGDHSQLCSCSPVCLRVFSSLQRLLLECTQISWQGVPALASQTLQYWAGTALLPSVGQTRYQTQQRAVAIQTLFCFACFSSLGLPFCHPLLQISSSEGGNRDGKHMSWPTQTLSMKLLARSMAATK
mmetsp:Transcript_20900/g.53965  ORF Transcript_20900/g.53965 Transcript_20900/m.53965 type:complete len:226 (+) Transcript_20900:382-1059(+)